MFDNFTRSEVLSDLQEVRREISRLNRARGETVFNPAATDAVQKLIDDLLADEGAEVIDDILEGKH